MKSRCKNCGNIFYGSTIEHYQVCPKCQKKSGVPYHGSSPVSESSPERSQVWIDKWEREREEYIKRGKPLSKLEERIARHKASLILGRDFGEDADAYKRRMGLTEYYDWKLDAPAIVHSEGGGIGFSEEMKVHTEGGGIGFSFPRTSRDSKEYAWGKAGLFDTPSLYTNKYNSVAVGGKSHALLKILSEVDEENKMVDKNYLKNRYFTPHQAHTVANLSPEGVKKLISKPTYLPEALKGLQSNGAVVVVGNKRRYHTKITSKGREILKILEDKHGDTRTGASTGTEKSMSGVITTPYSTDFKKVSMKTDDGRTITVGVPTNLPPEREVKYFETIFNSVKNESNWKAPTRTVTVNTRTEADLLARSIRHYAGGAEVEDLSDGKFRVGSKGYYHYIGA